MDAATILFIFFDFHQHLFLLTPPEGMTVTFRRASVRGAQFRRTDFGSGAKESER